MLLEPIYEQDFFDGSYGFRPGRSAHQALQAVRAGVMGLRGRWVLDVDVRKYFDSIDRARLREFLTKRVTDGVVRRLIDKWLKAGVLEDGQLFYPDKGTPQGGVVSPCLANIFLHYVLDEWYSTQVVARLKGLSHTYPDDLDVLLVGPGGQKLLLMSDAGGGGNLTGLTFVFDSAAAGTLANSSQLAAGTFRPSNYGTGDTFAAPAPAGPYASTLTTFNGGNPNGLWTLYVVDDGSGDSGTLSGGWELTITSGTLLKTAEIEALEEAVAGESLGEDGP